MFILHLNKLLIFCQHQK